MRLYYTNELQAIMVAEDFKCCGYETKITYNNELYEVLVTEN